MIRPLFLASTLALSACSTSFQTTSGARYLSVGEIDSASVAAAAAHEPRLEFPARIGVIRLVYGRLTTIPSEERALFTEALDGRDNWGEFVMLGPLEAQLNRIPAMGARPLEYRRLGASRHLDYILFLAYDPTRNSAEALFMDVRSGYPYASIEADVPGSGATNFWGNRLRNPARIDRESLRLARALAPELSGMFAGFSERAE